MTFQREHEGRRVRVRRFELAPLALRKEVATWNRHRQKKKWQAADAGGSAAREGGRDACGGRGAHFWVVRHLKVPI